MRRDGRREMAARSGAKAHHDVARSPAAHARARRVDPRDGPGPLWRSGNRHHCPRQRKAAAPHLDADA